MVGAIFLAILCRNASGNTFIDGKGSHSDANGLASAVHETWHGCQMIADQACCSSASDLYAAVAMPRWICSNVVMFLAVASGTGLHLVLDDKCNHGT